ncbi:MULTISPECIES: class D sortase [Bacillus amyloliquefaciens group]|uniref:class D sortase n=1 Tax=Bacillus amyloliquefaciens group TaxID=1938374 RepID=UPI001CD2C373|nr:MULTISPECIES: class D sortase [Bacillus amyloliquefaciens group]HBO5951997.1 class D sortase [Pseudomonas aeruginosa]MCV4329506.1 class D sortase [Bacillus velezensis]MDH3075875.1 class D sortase [Bacillus velezensis]MDH3104059.1 class D sortase [Bacillus velezensis]MDH3139037.1 class D sortase [Bacillus velezensis]
MKSKLFPVFLIIVGLLVAWFGGGKDIISSKQKTNTSLAEAKEIIKESKTEKASENNKQEGKNESFQVKNGETVGILSIPKIDAELPIVEGTAAEDLSKGVGHYKGSSYPNENGQIVLSGHRDTVFRRTGELKHGDTLKLSLSYGEFEYKITDTKIVDENDTSVITLQHKEEELILTTCYPFSYIGDAPERYIIYAAPI